VPKRAGKQTKRANKERKETEEMLENDVNVTNKTAIDTA
jgi:hypothetical protein